MSDVDLADIQNSFENADADIEAPSEEELKDAFNHVSFLGPDEAARAVINSLAGDHADAVKEEYFGGGSSDTVPISNIPALGEGEWISITGAITKMFDVSETPSKAASGVLVGEGGETVRFDVWDKSVPDCLGDGVSIDDLEQDAVVSIENVPIDEYKGSFSVNVNSNSTVELVDDDDEAHFDAKDAREAVISGRVVAARDGNGLIERCPKDNCTRVLRDDTCEEHGNVDGEWDLRLKLTIDDGIDADEVTLNHDVVTDLTGIDLEEAVEMAEEALDTSVVQAEMLDDLMLQTVEATAVKFGNTWVANDFSLVADAMDFADQSNNLLQQARSAKAQFAE